MGLFDFFKKKATEEQPQTEEQQEGVLELDGVEVETDAQEADIVLDVEDGQDMNRAVHAVMDEEEIQIDRAGEDILYREDAEEAPAEAEIEITFEDADGEEILTAEDAAEAEAVLDELTEIAGEILAEKPLAEDEVIVATEDGEIFTADNDADGRAFVEELADEVAEELNQEEPTEEAQETPAEESAEEEKPAKMGFFAKLKAGLDKTRKNILGGVDGVLGAFTKIDEDLFEELEEALIMADMGVQTTMDIVENLRKRVKREHATDPAVIKDMLIDEITAILQEGAQEDKNLPSPSVLLVIGVNGVGKTTTIGKLAHNFKEDGKSVLLAAADTFRAAAIDQLAVWCERSGAELVRQNEGSDPAAVVFDACHAAKNKHADVLIIDTAGRLHNKTNLMNELAKINRVIDRELPGAARENLLVLDATTGQNAIIQAKEFKNAAALTGLILNKLDGTAKGGIVISIRKELNIPVKFIGVGEKLDDMQEFDRTEFVRALFEG